MWVLLSIVASLLIVLLAPIGVAFGFFREQYFKKLSISLDQFGNVAMMVIFDDILITKESIHLFGNPDETISSVLGKNKVANTLAPLGKFLDSILNKIDKNHSIKSIEK